MHAGNLKHRIIIQQRTNTQDASGQPLETWSTFATVWANITPLIGRDYLAARQLVDEVDHDVTIRYRSGVLPKMRISYDGRTFEIISVINKDEGDAWMYLKCKEVVDD
jgi:SPP1 family predicted phage head-tail adaptor